MLTKDDVANWPTNTVGHFAEMRTKKVLTAKGYDVTKIVEKRACNDFVAIKDDEQYIVEVKGAKDWGYSAFFCELAQKRAEETVWQTSFWLGQDIDIFVYYSFSENSVYLYDGKKFREAAFNKMSNKNLITIPKGTGRGFVFDKRSEEMGFIECVKHQPATSF